MKRHEEPTADVMKVVGSAVATFLVIFALSNAARSQEAAAPVGGHPMTTVEGTLLTRSEVPLWVDALCSQSGGRILVHGPREYCGTGLLSTPSGDRHEYIPLLRRIKRISDADWKHATRLDTYLSPSEILDLICRERDVSEKAANIFKPTSRRQASADEQQLSISGLVQGSNALSCPKLDSPAVEGNSVKSDGVTHPKSGLTVRDHSKGVVVVSWIEPVGPCTGRQEGDEKIELTRPSPDGSFTCVGQLGTAPAQVAGVIVGDVVIRVGNKSVARAADLAALLDASRAASRVLMYRGDLRVTNAATLRNSATTATCNQRLKDPHGVTAGRFYCWTWNPASVGPPNIENLGEQHRTGAPSAARPIVRPPATDYEAPGTPSPVRTYLPMYGRPAMDYEAVFKEYGCPSCEDVRRFKAEYLNFVKGRGCDLSKCDAGGAER